MKSLLPFGILLKTLLVVLCLHLGCVVDAYAKKRLITSTQYEIQGVEVGSQGSYLVRVYVYTKESSATTDEFKFAAVHGVIFRGFSGKGFTTQNPMARLETQNQYADFYNVFFVNGDYLNYADVVTPNSDRVKVGKDKEYKYKIGAIVSVSKDSLRKALESAGVIKNLNSGF